MIRKMTPLQDPAHSAYKKYFLTCCFSVHVQTATILIGIWHMLLNMLLLALIMIIYRDPNLVEELHKKLDVKLDLDAPALPTPLSKIEPMYVYRDHSLSYQPPPPRSEPGGLLCSFMVLITVMMIYGTIKGKPSHLLPFLLLQVFDLAMTLMAVVRYFYALEPIHHIIAKSTALPWREKLLELSPEQLMTFLLISYICVIWLKSYTAFIIFRCYKYLTLRNHCMRTLLPCLITDIHTRSTFRPEERPYSTLLPNYDEAIAHYMKQAPPPSYHVAMSNFQVPPITSIVTSNAVAPANIGLAAAAAAASVNVVEAANNNNYMSNNNNTVHVNANAAANDATTQAVPAPAPAVTDGTEVAQKADDIERDIETIVIDESVSTPPPTYNNALALEAQQNVVEAQPNIQTPIRSIQIVGQENGAANSSQV